MIRPSLSFLTRRRFWQRTTFTLIGLATLIAAIYVIEDYRGERAWNEYSAAARARGVKLYLEDFIPPRIPDDENFAAIPFFRELGSRDPEIRKKAELGFKLPHGNPHGDRISWERTPPDFHVWQKLFAENGLIGSTTDNPVTDVYLGLERYEPVLAALRQAAHRPKSQLLASWGRGTSDADIYYFGGASYLGPTIRLRIATLLALGEPDKAMDDARSLMQLANAFRNQPTLLPAMIRGTLAASFTQLAWDGLCGHLWSERHLAEFETYLRNVNFPDNLHHALASERGFTNTLLQECKAAPSMRTIQIDPFPLGVTVPSGWLAQNQVNINQRFDQLLASIPEIPRPSKGLNAYSFMVETVFFLMEKNKSYARDVQNDVQLCRVAIALERYRLRNGAFPPSLETLSGNLLPHVLADAFEHPFTYERQGDNALILYSFGKDGVDDGGDLENDDVWRFPPHRRATSESEAATAP